MTLRILSPTTEVTDLSCRYHHRRCGQCFDRVEALVAAVVVVHQNLTGRFDRRIGADGGTGAQTLGSAIAAVVLAALTVVGSNWFRIRDKGTARNALREAHLSNERCALRLRN